MDKCREQFEALMKAPPYEMTLDRHDDNGTWPGNYKAYHVQLAWCAWKELWNRRSMPAMPEGYAHGPVARVTGYFDGHCVVAPLNTAVLLPVGMALFANAAPQATAIDRDAVIDCDMIARMQDAIEGEFDGAVIDEQHAKAILEYVFGTGALKQSPATDDGMGGNAGVTGSGEKI